jgi:hypothetical protein
MSRRSNALLDEELAKLESLVATKLSQKRRSLGTYLNQSPTMSPEQQVDVATIGSMKGPAPKESGPFIPERPPHISNEALTNLIGPRELGPSPDEEVAIEEKGVWNVTPDSDEPEWIGTLNSDKHSRAEKKQPLGNDPLLTVLKRWCARIWCALFKA